MPKAKDKRLTKDMFREALGLANTAEGMHLCDDVRTNIRGVIKDTFDWDATMSEQTTDTLKLADEKVIYVYNNISYGQSYLMHSGRSESSSRQP